MEALNLDVERQPLRLRIETIDAFNAWLAGQLPVAAGAGSGFQVLGDATASYEEAARRALGYEEDDGFGAAVDAALALDDQRWRKLLSLIARMLPSRDRWLPLLAGRLQAASALEEIQLKRVRDHFDEDLRLLVGRALVQAQEALGKERIAALSVLMHGAAQRLDAEHAQMSHWAGGPGPVQADIADLERWRAIAWACLTGEGSFRRRLTKNEGFPPQCADKAPMLDLLAELDRHPTARRILSQIRALPAPFYSDEQWSRVRQVAQVLVLAAAQLDQVFREQGAVDFSAVSLAALRALGSAAEPTDLGLRLDYRLQHILVDEFQDTSSAQLELVRLMTAGWQSGDGRTLFCVGDPMQSIYGFRQAEVRAFLELAEDGIGDVRFDVQRLSDNFRSAKPLVDWINSCFSRILPQTDDRDRGAIAFRPSAAAAPEPPSQRTVPKVELRGFAARAEESAAIADMIEAQAAEHPQWRIVVLVRARAHAREIARQPARARDCLPRRRYRAAVGSCGGSRHHHAELRAAASGGPHGVAGAAARALGGDLPGRLAADFPGAAAVGCVVRRCRGGPAERGWPQPLPAAAHHAAGCLRRTQRGIDRALGRTHVAEHRRCELCVLDAGSGAGRRGLRTAAGTGTARRAGCRRPAGQPCGFVRGPWSRERGRNHDHSQGQGFGVRHGGHPRARQARAARPGSAPGLASIRENRTRRHGHGCPSGRGRRRRPAVRISATPATRCGRARSRTPAVCSLYPGEMAAAIDRDHRPARGGRGLGGGVPRAQLGRRGWAVCSRYCGPS